MVTEEVVAISNRQLIKFIFLRWASKIFFRYSLKQTIKELGVRSSKFVPSQQDFQAVSQPFATPHCQNQQPMFILCLQFSSFHRSGKSRLYQPGGNSDGVGTMVTKMDNDLWTLFANSLSLRVGYSWCLSDQGVPIVFFCRQEGRTLVYSPGASDVLNLVSLSIRCKTYYPRPLIKCKRLIAQTTLEKGNLYQSELCRAEFRFIKKNILLVS